MEINRDQNLMLDSKNVDVSTIIKEPIKNLAYYNRILTPYLEPDFFKRNPLRLIYLSLFLIGNIFIFYFLIQSSIPWYSQILFGLIAGYFNSALAFVSHETSHGSVIKNKFLQDVIVFFAFAPYLMSPTYWRFWHNRLHHGNTQYVLKDPDAFPTMSVYKNSPFLQKVFNWTPGAKTFRSYFYFFFWFSFQAFINQIYMRFKNKMWSEMNQNRVSVEFGLQFLMMATLIYFLGWNRVFYIAIAFMTQNYIIMSYISTNHNLSPLTKVNDPLLNSLTVTNYKFFDFLHLNFGYHVEHHLFPRMSGAYTRKTHEVIKKVFPETYHFMKKSEALKMLYSTARIYKSPTTLIHPQSLETFSTIVKINKT